LATWSNEPPVSFEAQYEFTQDIQLQVAQWCSGQDIGFTNLQLSVAGSNHGHDTFGYF